MSNDDDGSSNRTNLQAIKEAYQESIAARQYYNDAQLSGRVTQSIKRYLHVTAKNYYDVLRPYRTEDGIEDRWDEEGLDGVFANNVQTGRKLIQSPGRGSSPRLVESPQILDPQDALHYHYVFDDITRELGFMQDAKKTTTQTEITEEMIEGVEQWRKANLE